MSSHQSDEEEVASDGLELVSYGVSRINSQRKSFVDSQSDFGSTHPEAMIRLGMFANSICGRIFLLQSSKLTNEAILSSEDGKYVGVAPVGAYHTLVIASILKKRLQTHHFYSKHLVDVLEINPKRRKRSPDSDLLYTREIRKNVGSVCDAAIALEDTIATEKKLYNELLTEALEYPNYLSLCLRQINDHKSTLKEQVVDLELKNLIENERDMIKFVGELCSRLLVITPTKTSTMMDAFLATQKILNRVNGVL